MRKSNTYILNRTKIKDRALMNTKITATTDLIRKKKHYHGTRWAVKHILSAVIAIKD
jgi:hypothetical protein